MAQIVQPGRIEAAPLKRKGAGLNQLIAKTHKLGGQLLGLQITNGNLIAIFFSAIQITAGIVTFAWISMSGWALLLAPVCAPLALLIERLSLGGLMVFRTAGTERRKLEDEYFVSHLEKKATKKETYEYKRKLKRLQKDWWMSLFLILLGVGISGYVGDQFWQSIFRPVGEPNSTLLSLLIAGSVSLTFVFSELYAELSNKGITDAMRDNQISRAVLQNAEEDLQLELSMEAFGNLRGDPAKRLSVVTKIESGLTSRLEAFADRAEYLLLDGPVVNADPVQIVNVIPTTAQVLQIEQINEVQQISPPSLGSEQVDFDLVNAHRLSDIEIQQIRSYSNQEEWVAKPELPQTSEIQQTSPDQENSAEPVTKPAKKKRRDYKKIHDSFDIYLTKNPDSTLEELMQQFDIRQTTASEWRQEWRKRNMTEISEVDSLPEAEVSGAHNGSEAEISEGESLPVAEVVEEEAEISEGESLPVAEAVEEETEILEGESLPVAEGAEVPEAESVVETEIKIEDVLEHYGIPRTTTAKVRNRIARAKLKTAQVIDEM